jgi:hypothetical protein
VQFAGFSPYSSQPHIPCPTTLGDPSTPCLHTSQVNLSFFQFRIQFLNYESIFHVIGFLDGSNTCDAMGRISYSRATFDVAATTSSWILATYVSRCGFLVPTASRPKFQHSTPTVGPGILDVADAMGTSTWRASPAIGNASVDDTATTSFFTSNGKTHIRAFLYLYRNFSQCRPTL